MKFNMSSFVRLVRGRGDVPKEITDASAQGTVEKINQLVGYLRQQRDAGPLFAAPVMGLESQLSDLVKRVKQLEQEPKALVRSGIVPGEGVGQELLRPPLANVQLAKLDAMSDLKMTNGDTWTLASKGVQWPWYCKALKCNSVGTQEVTGPVSGPSYAIVNLKFPKSLSEDILTKGGPGVCGHAAGDIVAYSLRPDEFCVAGDGKVMSGDVLWSSLRIRYHLPIYEEPGSGEAYRTSNHRLIWMCRDVEESGGEPDDVFGYTTGWVVDTDFATRYIRGVEEGEEDPGDTGGSDVSGQMVDPTYVGHNYGALGPESWWLASHGHETIKPPYIAVRVIKWVCFA